ncbi:MAG: class II aldolase/adducin family protein [Chitinophagales bacterium]
MNKEGVIKFNCKWIKSDPLQADWIKDINDWRNKLYNAGLISENADGIGYGNISVRYKANEFIISGSSTGKLKKLSGEHFTLVTDYNLEQNSLTTVGPIKASSESLTHAIIYESQKDVNAVIHVHHLQLWKKLLTTRPATSNTVGYGTTAMAKEILRLFRESDLSAQKIFAMGGHEEGIVSFGKNLDEAGQAIFVQLIHLQAK